MSGPLGPVIDYLPHRPPMLLIEEILEVTKTRAVCRTTLRPDCVFAIDGKVHASSMIEFVAQTCAIAAGVTSSREGGPPRLGFIIGCREISFPIVEWFDVGDVLTFTVTKILGEEQLAAFNGLVHRDGTQCVQIQLSVVDANLAGAQATS